MTWFQDSFGWAGDLYARWFANWLHINFLIRTILLLLMMGLVIYVAGLIFKYIIGPLAVLFYINIIKRAWNYFVIETLLEWIYIRYYSEGSLRFANLYLRLCDKAKHNRAVLSYNKYKGVLHRGRVRKFGNSLMISAAIVATLWVVAFGIDQEYAMPAWAAVDNGQDEPDAPVENNHEPDETETGYEPDTHEESPATEIYAPGLIRPGKFPAGNVVLALTEEAADEGARLRDGPGITGTTVIEMLWGHDQMTFLGEYTADPVVEALYWLRVRTPSGTEGYIGSQLVEVIG